MAISPADVTRLFRPLRHVRALALVTATLVPLAASAEWAFEGAAGAATRAFTTGTNGTVFEASCTADGLKGFYISPAPVDLLREEEGRPLAAALKIDGEPLAAGLTCFAVACEVTHETTVAATITTKLRRGSKLEVEVDGRGVVESYSLTGSADAILKLADPGECTPRS